MNRVALVQTVELALLTAFPFLAGYGAARQDWFDVAICGVFAGSTASSLLVDIARDGLFGRRAHTPSSKESL